MSQPTNETVRRGPAALLPALVVVVAMPASAADLPADESRRPGVIVSPQVTWQFDAREPARSRLTVASPRAEFVAPTDATLGFTVKLNVELAPLDGDQTILEIPNVLTVRVREHAPRDRNRQNYPAFKTSLGRVPVIEASLQLHSAAHPDWKEMTVGIPIAMLGKPTGEHEVVLNFSGVRWSVYLDGALHDNDFPFGYPQWSATHSWTSDSRYVKTASLHVPAIVPVREELSQPRVAPVQYWTPPGHNSWVGDVVTFFHRGRYHVFYLYDRRHHQSKFGQGAHYFEHVSTVDFKTWTEHAAATPIEEQWECIGTGTPFVFRNQFCLAYGLHTGRVYPSDKTTWPAQWDYLEKYGQTGEFRRDTTPGVPAGSTYSVSADGVSKFKKTNIMFHPCQNPSVYTDPQGRLRMLANAGSKGMWESSSIDSGWRCVSRDFPPGGDCTFFFRWGKFDYIIGGFTGLWTKAAAAPDTAYADTVRSGDDFYDGLNVPAVTEIPGNRFLMAGWTTIRGWGGNLVIRELLQFSNGRIGSKWFGEITPATENPQVLALHESESTAILAPRRSFLLTFRVQATGTGKGRLGLAFLPAEREEASCEFQVSLEDRRAQFGPGSERAFAPLQKSLREGGAPQAGGNYAVEHLIGIEEPFQVRVIVKWDDKLGGSLIDAEIAGKRTMISFRPELTVRRLLWRVENLRVSDAQIAPLKD